MMEEEEASLLERLERLLDGFQEQQRQIRTLATRHKELDEENAALRDCLEVGGILREQEFRVRLHKRRFAHVLTQHPLQKCIGAQGLETLLSRTRELALTAGAFAGPACVGPLAAASKAIAIGLGTVACELSALFPPPAIYVAGGCGPCRGPTHWVERFDPAAGAAEPLASLSSGPRAVCSAVTFTGRVYVIAGHDYQGDAVDTVERFDPRHGIWVNVSPLQRARGWVSAVRIAATSSARSGSMGDISSGGICVLGGEGRDLTALAAAEYFYPDSWEEDLSGAVAFPDAEAMLGYHPLGAVECRVPGSIAAARGWTPLPRMRSQRWAGGAASIGATIFAAGGYDGDGLVLGAVECLTPGSDEWTPLPPLGRPRAAFAMAALRGRVFAVGGLDANERGLRCLECFDPAVGGLWEILPSMDSPRWGLSASVCGGHLYVLGGSSGAASTSPMPTENISIVIRFDPEAGAWQDVGRLRIARRCLAAATCR